MISLLCDHCVNHSPSLVTIVLIASIAIAMGLGIKRAFHLWRKDR